METGQARSGGDRDSLARVLELGLVAVVLLAPLPFGAVTPAGRLGLEISALVLGGLWLFRLIRRPAALPPFLTSAGLAGLLLLALLQALPLGKTAAAWLSPMSAEARAASLPSGEALAVERRLTGLDPARLDTRASLSVAPDSTASALRTGAALTLLLLVATTVASTCGVRRLALALLVSAAFQALYGILVLASGHEMIWNVPKKYYLHSATGTFVNRNHFAGLLALSLPCGLALVMSSAHRQESATGFRRRLLSLFSVEGTRTLLLGILLVLGLAGLLLSFSRAGIAFGLSALLLTVLAAARRGLRTRLVVAGLVLAVAAVPLIQIGADRLAERYARVTADLTGPGARGVVWKDTLGMALDFPLVGTGFGTFAAAYPLYRSPGVRAFYAHAHNDALQALAEGGILGAIFLAMILWPLLRRIVGALTGAGGTLAIGLASGLTALLLHALVDFNFHIPSNAAVAAILAGGLLGLPWNART